MVRGRARALRGLAAAALLPLLAGCSGSGSQTRWAGPQTLMLGGAEECGPPGRSIRFDLDRLEIQRDRWRVSGSLVNGTGAALGIVRPHTEAAGTYFGLLVVRSATGGEVARRARESRLHVQLIADSFEPALPRLLSPGAGWRGVFSGPGRLPRNRDVRVVLGRFTVQGRPPPGLFRGFLCVSERGPRTR